jgi:hypothetical protein
LFPIFIFATRKSIIVDEKLDVKYKLSDKDISFMIDKVYGYVLKERLRDPFSSTSDLFRNPRIYNESEEMFKAKTSYDEDSDYTLKYRVNLKDL